MRNSDRFLDLYNRLDHYLREKTDLTDRHRHSFSAVLEEAVRRDATVRRHRSDIRGYIALRNAIVHESRHGEPIAEPHTEAVAEFERYVERITEPRRLDSLGSSIDRLFAPTAPLADLLRYLRRNDYSQAVVWSEGDGTRLLSSAGIARWLESNAGDGIVELDGVSLSPPLAQEPEGTCMFLSRARVVAEAQELFEGKTSTPGRLSAILVTENGRSRERPLRIITPWDLLALE